MGVTYLSPGVYVEERDTGIKPIQAVGTSMAAFVGITAEASKKRIDQETGERVPEESCLNKAILISNWTEFTTYFGGFMDGAFLPDAVYGYFSNGGGPCYVTSLRALTDVDQESSAASAEIPSTGKATCFKVTATMAGPAGNNLKVTIKHNTAPDDKSPEAFTMSVGGQSLSGLNMKKSGSGTYIEEAEFDAITISDIGGATLMPDEGVYPLTGGGLQPLSAEDFIGDPGKRTGLGGLEVQDEIRLVLCPDVMAGYDGSDAAKARVRLVQEALISHCERMRYRFAILDTPPDLTAQQAKEWKEYVNFDSSYAALYYPWIEVADLSDNASLTKHVPPSGHMAGVYNRSDGERSVHKAPANEVIRGAVGLAQEISRNEQDTLNPIGVNCIRAFPGRGIRVWGARTLSSNGAWRYVNVRRLFIMVEASMDAGLQWVVFEPNDTNLWARVTRDVTGFLRVVWRSGALFGTTESQAFYVKCDEELNTQEIRDMGQLIIEVGMAPVKPAEFVIFRISQWAGANAEE
jgi:hypothetical protein